MSSDQGFQAIIQDPSTSYWLRDPLDVANDAEYLAMHFAIRAQKAAEAMVWLAAQRAASQK